MHSIKARLISDKKNDPRRIILKRIKKAAKSGQTSITEEVTSEMQKELELLGYYINGKQISW